MELIFLAVVLVLLFLPSILMGRKQRAQHQSIQEFQRSLEPGDKVVTTAGMYGQIVQLTESTVDLEVSPGVLITFDRVAMLKFQDQPRDPYAVEDVPEDTEADAAQAGEKPQPEQVDSVESPGSQEDADQEDSKEKDSDSGLSEEKRD